MLNLLIRVARALLALGVIAFIIIGAGGGAAMMSGSNQTVGIVLGGIAGFIVAAVIFGALAALLDMQRSLRILVAKAERPPS